MKFTAHTLPASKPRNPLVAAAHLRRAGSHAAGTGALRQRARRQLQRALQQEARGPSHSDWLRQKTP